MEGGEEKHTVVLVHGIRVLGPGLEVVLVKGEFLRERSDVCGVFVEEDLFVVSTDLPVQQLNPSERDVQFQPHS